MTIREQLEALAKLVEVWEEKAERAEKASFATDQGFVAHAVCLNYRQCAAQLREVLHANEG